MRHAQAPLSAAHAIQKLAALGTALAIVFTALAIAPGKAAAAVAPNDLLGDATYVSDNVFDDSPDMSIADWEAGEPTPCIHQAAQGSVWYTFWNPALSGLRIEINGDQDNVSAAVYGPLGEFPGSVAELDGQEFGGDQGCIFGVGPDAAWMSGIDRGWYVIQLTSGHEWTDPPAIHIGRNFAWFYVDWQSIQVTSATVDRAGNIGFEGTAKCELQWWDPGWPQAWFNGDPNGDGWYGYDVAAQVSQALGRKTLLTGEANGYIDCTNTDENGQNHWSFSVRSNNGKFGPNLTNMDMQIGAYQCDENSCSFNSFVGFYDYVKVTKAH